MLDVNQYLEYIKSLLIVNPVIEHFHVLKEISQRDLGLYRIRAELTGGDFIELFEFFKIVQGKLKIDKYSFHWQNASGALIKRWDNASHFPEIKVPSPFT